MFQKKNDHLLVIFTRNIGLIDWIKNGSIEREVALYNLYLIKGLFKKITFLTFNSLDITILNSKIFSLYFHKDIEIIVKNKFFDKNFILKFLYFIFSPIIHINKCSEADVVKTNQFDTFFPAFFFKFFLKKKIIYRGGYLHSELFNNFYYRLIEKLGFKYFDKIIITSEELNLRIQKKYSIHKNKVSTIPNFIDTDKFKDLNLKRKLKTILYVGRVDKQKNLINLIEACIELKLNLHIYGTKSLFFYEFEKYFSDSIKYFGKKNNSDLVKIYNSYMYFFLPSFQEGNPKTLIEAMACGCICIGSNVNGIKNLIIDEHNGFLSYGFDKKNLKTAIIRAMNFNDVKFIKKNAINQITKSNNLKTYIEKEYNLLVN